MKSAFQFNSAKDPFQRKWHCIICISSSILYWAQIQIFGEEKKNHSSRAMARTKRRRKEEEESQRGGNKRRRPTPHMMTEAELIKRKRRDEAWAEHVQLELAGELSAETSSWKGRVEELERLLEGTSWEVVEELRDEKKPAIVCPVCALEITARGRQFPSIVPCRLLSVHLDRIHQIKQDLYLTCPICKKIPGVNTSMVETHYERCFKPSEEVDKDMHEMDDGADLAYKESVGIKEEMPEEIKIKEEVPDEVKIEGFGEAETSSSFSEYFEPSNPGCEIKSESGMVINVKSEIVEESYEEQTREELHENVPQVSNKEQILKIRADNIDKDKVKIRAKNIQKDESPYQFLYDPKAGHCLAWKCWITNSDGLTISARDSKKKGAMCKVAQKAQISPDTK